ncbi:MAG: glycosyltransferase family 39 protein, partial [Candidatus Eisenbacteria bacterium]|nr:glycosyltransferase family 39 protein [Candidatus Eisenbacteria bacterium]
MTRDPGRGRRIGLLFGVPFLLRVAVFAELRGLAFFQSLFVDARTYQEQAVRLLTGAPAAPGPFWQPPLYPYALSWLYRITGPNVDAARFAQAALGSVSCVLLFAITDRVGGRRAAWIAWGGM